MRPATSIVVLLVILPLASAAQGSSSVRTYALPGHGTVEMRDAPDTYREEVANSFYRRRDE